MHTLRLPTKQRQVVEQHLSAHALRERTRVDKAVAGDIGWPQHRAHAFCVQIFTKGNGVPAVRVLGGLLRGRREGGRDHSLDDDLVGTVAALRELGSQQFGTSIAVEQRLMDIVCRMGQRLTENVLDALVQIDRVCVHLPPSVVIAPDRQSPSQGPTSDAAVVLLLLHSRHHRHRLQYQGAMKDSNAAYT